MQENNKHKPRLKLNKQQLIILIVGSAIIVYFAGLLTGLKIVEKDVNHLRNKVDKQEQELETIKGSRK
ncbi:hypothetical protein KA529_04150 [Candidatus Saccharibacteria bacterium]|nr:hypothetical protein [Candidatus Saccharibacteria bacterium]